MQTITTATNETTTPKVDFGNGRYSSEMERLYLAFQKMFNIPAAKAERIARQAGSDAGAIFRNSNATIAISKASKDGKVTIQDASKVKGVTITNPLALVRALQWIDDAGKNFISFGHTKWVLTPELLKWIDEIEVK